MNTINSSANADSSLQEIQVFENTEFGKIRSLIIDDKPWFVGKDVAESLGYKDTVNALKLHVDDDDKTGWQITTQFGTKETKIINESGLYSLILGSKLKSAKKFKRWVTSEVLPSIRKTGSYNMSYTKIIDPVHDKELGLARAEFFRSMALEYNGKSETYKQILDAYAVKELAGEFILPLPEVKQRSYSAGEVGKILGISANKVGSIAIRNGLKTKEYGCWVHDKSRYSGKEVDTFRYYDNAITEIRKLMNEKEVIA